jgi:hypothetical protein
VSHFSVLVTGDDVDTAMAPFDENLETARYLRRTKAQIIADERRRNEEYRDSLYAKYLADPDAYAARHGNNNPSHLRYLRDEFPAKLGWTDEQIYADAIRWHEPDELDAEGNEWSERNPVGYWDYWRVGGRWAGHLPLRNGRVGHMEPLSWEWTDYISGDKPDALTHADVARKGDVNLEALDPTFAILHEGEWVARGEMGWFGALREERIPEEEWPQKWHEFVAALPDDTRLTVVDCHV